MSPYLNDVVNTTLKGYDDNANQTRQGQMLDLANDSTFGGSGGSILRALTEGQIGQGRAATEAGLRQQGFETALGAANNDANRYQNTNDLNAQLSAQGQDRTLSAAAQLQNLITSNDANARANLAAQGDIGAQLRDIEQQRLGAPLNLLATQAGLFGSLPLGLLHGQVGDSTGQSNGTSTTTVSDPLGSLSSLMSGAGSLAMGLAAFSDRRLKRDIVKIGERPDGLGLYLFRYLWSPVRHLGVMAQEVLKVKPDAVIRHESGFLMVDYGAL
jgi:hypothetical protein